MLYVQESLSDDESLIHIGEFSIIYTLQALLAIVWGILGSVLVILAAIFAYQQLGQFPKNIHIGFLQAIPNLHIGIRIGAFFVFFMGILTFTQMMIYRLTTEIAVTNKRLLYKRGVIARNVNEMSVDRIEGVNVRQSFLGRLMNYGRLAVRGMGVGEVVLPPIDEPIKFRQAIENAKSKKDNTA